MLAFFMRRTAISKPFEEVATLGFSLGLTVTHPLHTVMTDTTANSGVQGYQGTSKRMSTACGSVITRNRRRVEAVEKLEVEREGEDDSEEDETGE